MKIENLKEINILTQYIDGIDEFIDNCGNNTKSIKVENSSYRLSIKEDQGHEIINALEKIKSNMVERLKELGVEV